MLATAGKAIPLRADSVIGVVPALMKPLRSVTVRAGPRDTVRIDSLGAGPEKIRMPALLPPDQLPAGNSLFSAATQAGTFIGPVLGGAVVAAASPAPAFLIDAATFAVSAASLALIGRRLTPAAAGPACVARW